MPERRGPRRPLAVTHPELAAEWDYDHPGNAGFSPQTVSKGQDSRFWWVCDKHPRPGLPVHSFRANLRDRAAGTDCPVGTGGRNSLLAGFNDLATTDPVLAAQWDRQHPENAGMDPTTVPRMSARIVWWTCTKHPRPGRPSHSYPARVCARVWRGSGCPVDAGGGKSKNAVLVGFNDLATTHPDIAAECDIAHPGNNGLTPQDVSASSKKVLYWFSRVNGDSVPRAVKRQVENRTRSGWWREQHAHPHHR